VKSSSNLLRRTGLACLGLGAAVTTLAFTFILNPNTGLPTKWPAGPIPLTISLGDTANLSDGTSFNHTAYNAALKWNAVIGSAQFQVTTAPPADPAQQNGINEMVFASTVYGRTFPAGVAGVTSRGVRGNTVFEADITLNTAFTWDSYRGAPRATVDLLRVALHELGHSLGLGHPDQAGQNVASIMDSRSNTVDSLWPDDISGVQAIYGPPGVPANDAFASATLFVLANGGVGMTTLKGVNTNATKETGEPLHDTANASNSGGRSVWWRWVAPAAGSVILDTKGSYFDTALGVYTGSSVSSLTTITSNDDIEAGVIQASSVSFNVTGGTSYHFAVDGFNNDDGHGADSGGITLNVVFNYADGIAPAITEQPVSTAVPAGGSTGFSVAATGSNPLSYQWRFNSNPIAGATSASLSLTSVTSAQAGVYSVTVSNAAGSVTSTGATLTVNTPAPPPSSGGGGGGGGGAPSPWFCAVLAMLGLARFLARRQIKASA